VGSGKKGRSFLFEARVEGGTYIRKLCSDLGEMIGGAHMGELRRTHAGIFDESGVESRESIGRLVGPDEFEEAVRKAELSKGADGKLLANGDAGDLAGMIVRAEDAIRKVLPIVDIDKSAVKSLHIGRPLFANNVLKKPKLKEGDVFATFCGDVFIGIYRRTSEEIIFGRSEFVYN